MDRLANILLVDDNPNDADLFRIFLIEEDGIEMNLEVASSGDDALERLSSVDKPLPDIVLLDVNMPRLDGFEVLDDIRNNLGLQNLAVSMLSTSGDEFDIEQAFNNGANHYMLKPADYEQICRLVDEIPNIKWAAGSDNKRIVRVV